MATTPAHSCHASKRRPMTRKATGTSGTIGKGDFFRSNQVAVPQRTTKKPMRVRRLIVIEESVDGVAARSYGDDAPGHDEPLTTQRRKLSELGGPSS